MKHIELLRAITADNYEITIKLPTDEKKSKNGSKKEKKKKK